MSRRERTIAGLLIALGPFLVLVGMGIGYAMAVEDERAHA